MKQPERVCTIPGCGNKHLASGLCRPHYDSKRRDNPLVKEGHKQANREYYARKRCAPGGKIDWRIRAETAERRVEELESALRKYTSV